MACLNGATAVSASERECPPAGPIRRARLVNRRALGRLAEGGQAMTSVLNVLEVCGILSFNLSATALHGLYLHFARRYRVTVVPAAAYDTRLPAPSAAEVLARMEQRMALKDAKIALVVGQHTATLEAVVTWNANHFAGKLAVPALTPRKWLRRGSRR